MATAREIITRSLRRLRVVGITEDPPAEVVTHSLNAFNDLLSAYEADGLSTETIIIIGNVTNGSKSVTDLNNSSNLYNTSSLAVGMEVSGTGVSSRIHEIVSTAEIKLTDAATASGTGVTLTFSALPMDDSLTEALVSVLAVRLAEDFGRSIGPVLARDAKRGQAQIDGAFFKVPNTDRIERTLTDMPSRRHYGEFIDG